MVEVGFTQVDDRLLERALLEPLARGADSASLFGMIQAHPARSGSPVCS